MLKDFEGRYLEMYWELQKQQWCNYFDESSYDLSKLDKEMYKLVCLYSDKIKVSDRKSQIANLFIRREFVDKNPNVSQLRNRIDCLENYSENIPDGFSGYATELSLNDIRIVVEPIESLDSLRTLEYTRCTISALFEFDLWEEPNKAEELYEKYYSKLGLKIDDCNIWAYDSFRSIDPVYIHNYVIGATLAQKLIDYWIGYNKLDNKNKVM